eukprot:9237954-Pyramimonas_sp.AAC.1
MGGSWDRAGVGVSNWGARACERARDPTGLPLACQVPLVPKLVEQLARTWAGAFDCCAISRDGQMQAWPKIVYNIMWDAASRRFLVSELRFGVVGPLA